ncbi:hypothetical protein C8F01DRAFT_775775 [Mycena amicta]|nr:hypothetical protein C8F01DRAFT_775775 [Mycena amicta]
MPSSSSRQPRNPPRRPGRAPKLVHPAPIHDRGHILAEHSTPEKPLPTKHANAPKSSVNNFAAQVLGGVPKYDSVLGVLNGRQIWRTTVQLETTPPVIAVGDDPVKSDSVMLAAFSSALQLHRMGILDNPPKIKATKIKSTSPITVSLSDSTVATYEQARTFMDYYCHRFAFGKPDVTFEENRKGWEAFMDVGGRKIGFGKANNKENAEITCYLDVTAYLEGCDPDLWKAYLEAFRWGWRPTQTRR